MLRSQIRMTMLPMLFAVSVVCNAAPTVQCGDAMQAEADKDYQMLMSLADKGDHCAELSLGRAYLWGDEKLKRNAVLALEFTARSARSGLAIAQYELALMYMGGHGINADYKDVVYWLTKASNQGNISAKTTLGRLLTDGRLVKRDLQRGLRLLLEADKDGGVVARQLLEKMADSLVGP